MRRRYKIFALETYKISRELHLSATSLIPWSIEKTHILEGPTRQKTISLATAKTSNTYAVVEGVD